VVNLGNRSNRLVMNGERGIEKIDKSRCPLCTLKPPCNHYTEQELMNMNNQVELDNETEEADINDK